MRILLYFLLLAPSFLWCQNDWSALSISDYLLDNADSVLREESFKITAPREDQIILNHHSVVTVLNKKGNSNVNPYISYSDGMKINEARAVIYDRSGKEIKRFKKKEMADRSAVDGGTLYSDARLMYVPYSPEEYPYTIEFSYELEDKSTGFIPNWSARREYNHSIVKRSFEIEYNPVLELKYKVFNDPGNTLKIESDNGRIKIEVKKLKAIAGEERSPNIANVNPQVMFAFNNFEYKGLKGRASDWKSLGKWEYENLILGLDEIPAKTKDKISKLVAGVSDPKEKVKLIYNYVQENTRYISVQLGIGGLRPYAAKIVDDLGYGDCKGLTNYTMALLKTQGIESYYAEVYSGSKRRNIQKEFASIQGNHVILNVPLEDEEVWLECTSKTLPFNFLGDFTDDRDVLVLTPEGGVIKHTHVYESKGNKLLTDGAVSLDAQGNLVVEAEMKSYGIQYDGRYPMETLKQDDKYDAYRSYWHYINNIRFESVETKNDKDKIEFVENVKFSCDSYANFVGNDMILPVNVLNRLSHIPKKYQSRALPLQIGRGFVDIDTIKFSIPSGFTLKEIPEPRIHESEFGTYSSSIEQLDDGTLLYKRNYSLNDGTFHKEKYKDYRSFLRKVSRSDNQKIILTKI